MKSNLHFFSVWFGLLCFCLVGCTIAGDTSVISSSLTPTTPPPTWTATVIPLDTATLTQVTPSATLSPTTTFTQTPVPFVLPAVTMSPQEVEAGLLQLLKTNGDCTGKCIGGIRPDEMTVQEAVDVMSQWGMVRVGKNSQGKTFINLDPNLLYGEIGVYLSVGTWTKELETIDTVALRILDFGSGDSNVYVEEEWWRENWDAWAGVRLDNLLKAYGIPSFAGFDFASDGSYLPGRTIYYGLAIQYEQTNMVILMGALAYYDGETIFLCPSSDPHYLDIVLNPERPLHELQQFSPVTWEALTATDLEAFYEVFTDENNPDACVTTTLEQLQVLQPDFR